MTAALCSRERQASKRHKNPPTCAGTRFCCSAACIVSSGPVMTARPCTASCRDPILHEHSVEALVGARRVALRDGVDVEGLGHARKHVCDEGEECRRERARARSNSRSLGTRRLLLVGAVVVAAAGAGRRCCRRRCCSGCGRRDDLYGRAQQPTRLGHGRRNGRVVVQAEYLGRVLRGGMLR